MNIRKGLTAVTVAGMMVVAPEALATNTTRSTLVTGSTFGQVSQIWMPWTTASSFTLKYKYNDNAFEHCHLVWIVKNNRGKVVRTRRANGYGGEGTLTVNLRKSKYRPKLTMWTADSTDAKCFWHYTVYKRS